MRDKGSFLGVCCGGMDVLWISAGFVCYISICLYMVIGNEFKMY
jgi:hypothetical protein